MRDKPKQLVKSLDRALNILEVVSHSKEPLGVTELSNKTDLNKSTVYRMLNTLKYRGYIAQNNEKDKYTTGLKLFELGNLVIDDLDLRKTSVSYLKELMELTGETVHLGILDEGEVIYIEKVESSETIRMHSKIGKRVYAHNTSLGKILLAYSDKETIENILNEKGLPQTTENTITKKDKFKDHLRQVKKLGYAVDKEESEEGINCIAGAIFNHKGEITAAFSISVPKSRLNIDITEKYGDLILKYSRRISAALGYNESW
ncbi:MAG: IclR family transcriptional regulator [Bacillota bacterium]